MAIPYLITPGNHDNPQNLIDVFGVTTEGDDGLYSQPLPSIICLDTSQSMVSPEQLLWLQHKVDSLTSEALIFLHHPPQNCHCLFMDRKYPLHYREDLFEILAGNNNVRNLFCGHYHIEKTIPLKAKRLYLTPATMMQINPNKDHYEVLSLNPGWRLIDWIQDILKTYVRYP